MDKPFAITLDPGSSLANRTGSWRTMRPVYVDRLPPCNNACPAGENIQQWLYHAEGGDYQAAWRQLVQDNPLPAIMGRVCYHPCETACNRAQLDEAVGINSVERFLGDEALKRHWKFDPPTTESGKRVLVVGAGPSGLSAAYHLRRRGHAVTIYEAGPFAGGMMRFGIPSYRLPRDVLDAEVRRILDLGVELQLNRKVATSSIDMRAGGFDAAFLAVGAHIAQARLHPGRRGRPHARRGFGPAQHGRVRTSRCSAAASWSMAAAIPRSTWRGPRSAWVRSRSSSIGARARRCRRTTSRSRRRLAEGVLIKWLSTIRNMEDGGTLTVEKMALDDKGFPQPTGELETLEADSLVLALGQDVDLSLLKNVPGLQIKDGTVQVAPNMMTGHAGIFAGGDMVPSERTVTVAVGHGKKAALHIDAWLQEQRRSEHRETRARDLRAAQHLVLQRCAEDGATDARRRAPHLDLRGSPARAD